VRVRESDRIGNLHRIVIPGVTDSQLSLLTYSACNANAQTFFIFGGITMILQKYHAAWAGSGRRALLCVLAYSFLIGTLGAQEVDVPALLAAPDAATSIVPADAPALKNPKMRWAPDDFAKDPTVIRFKGAYYMYFSIPPQEKDGGKYGWTTGIAKSDDLVNWQLVTNLLPEQEVTKKGFCAPCARVYDDKVFLFYQSYGNGPKDAICMSVSEDGINFKPHPKNPIFRPHGDWTNGRAIDADLIRFKDKFFLYAATRDPAGAIQKIVVATADAAPEQLSELEPEDWTQAVDRSILDPELPWETNCIEAPTTIIRGDKLYMFYAGGYNNDPQHIGVAVSDDGVNWIRLWNVPFITNGPKGQWNESESGHPGVFVDDDGQTWLFFQGNNTHGKNWFLSRVKIDWKEQDGVEIPVLVEE